MAYQNSEVHLFRKKSHFGMLFLSDKIEHTISTCNYCIRIKKIQDQLL